MHNDDSQSQEEQKCQPTNDICDTDTRFCCKNCGTDLFEDKQFLCSFSRKHFMNEVLSSDVICIRYTGVPNRSMLKGIFQWLKQTAKNIKLWDGKRKYIPKRKQGRKRYTLTLFEEFVLTLVRIRRGYDINHFSFLFGISQSHVCRIFITWVNFLAKCFEQLIIWPSKQLVKENFTSIVS